MELDLSVGSPWEARATIRIHKVGLDGLICAKGGPNKCLDNNFMKVSYSDFSGALNAIKSLKNGVTLLHIYARYMQGKRSICLTKKG